MNDAALHDRSIAAPPESWPGFHGQRSLVAAYLQGSPDCIEHLDADKNIVSVNAASARSLGIPDATTLHGQAWPSLWPGEARAEIEAALLAAGRGTAARLHLCRWIGEGAQSWWDVVLTAVAAADGTLAGWLAVSRDVTEQKLAEARLRESEEHHRYTIELNPHIPWTADPEGNILEAGPRLLHLTGMTAHDVLGPQWLESIHPDCLPQALTDWWYSIETGEPLDSEWRLRTTEGSYRWLRVRGAPRRDANGSIIRWYGTAEDIHDRKTTEERLLDYRHIVELNPQVSWVADPAGRVISFGDCWPDFCLSKCEALEKGWLDIIHPEDREPAAAALIACLRSGQPYDVECRTGFADGSYRWYHLRAAARRDEQGAILRWYGTAEDVHARKTAELALKQSEAMLRLAQEAGRIGSFSIDLDAGSATCSPTFLALHGLPADTKVLPVETLTSCLHPEDRERHSDEVRQALAGLQQFETEFRIVRPDGAVRWVRTQAAIDYREDGRPAMIRGVEQDITERKDAQLQLQASEAKARHLANHDTLTGLPNRRAFTDHLIGLSRKGAAYSVLYMDLDGFKEVNDTFGHATGDLLLRRTSERLQRLIPDDGFLARLGGDEFAIAVADQAQAQLEKLAAAIVGILQEPHEIGHEPITVGSTIGIAVSDAAEYEDVIRRADIAMYAAKARGRNGWCFFDQRLDDGRHERKTLASELRRAVADGDLSVVYQPIVRVADGKVTAMEALARWTHPVKGAISPDVFIPVAEETGLIVELGRYVLRKACLAARDWPLNLAVNLSPAQFWDRSLVDNVLETLAECGFPPDRLEFEITENYLLRRPDAAAEVIARLRSHGIKVALDDFGTGYASIGYLRRFELDMVKLDRSFVEPVAKNAEAADIANAVIALGSALKLPILAEGVETQAQAMILSTAGCSYMQGWHFGCPVPAGEVDMWLKDAKSPAKLGAAAGSGSGELAFTSSRSVIAA